MFIIQLREGDGVEAEAEAERIDQPAAVRRCVLDPGQYVARRSSGDTPSLRVHGCRMRVAARVAVRGRQSGTSLALRVRASTNAFGSALPSVVAARGWEGAWAQHCTPWDAGRAAPALTHLLASEALPPGPVLVPGCGAGWDALACAAAGRPTLGIDLSATAVARCRERQAADVRTRGLPPSALDFRVADFFAFAPRQPFSVVWDYTFMSALRSDAWPRWAATMWRLVAPQG